MEKIEQMRREAEADVAAITKGMPAAEAAGMLSFLLSEALVMMRETAEYIEAEDEPHVKYFGEKLGKWKRSIG